MVPSLTDKDWLMLIDPYDITYACRVNVGRQRQLKHISPLNSSSLDRKLTLIFYEKKIGFRRLRRFRGLLIHS